MRFPVIAPAILFVLASAGAASATAHIHINLSTQTMHVQSSSGSYSWPVSTARAGYSTPRGSFAPTGMQPMHYSRKYHMSPMPHSIFFRGGYAIHGSYETGMLGRPASHGCVRLSPGHAAMLYQMVQNEGGRISISGARPHGHYYASARRSGGGVYAASRGRQSYGVGRTTAEPFSPFWSGGFD
ncbi:MAG: L,D-transpeptidase [Alphaproteobacteria bacterium]|nr:L,D-transpeptidase [Alphaproteobacteria bacterium]MBM3624384.1 L,D-transpeptidase [Alphaproteobacteria bacterium]